AAGVDPAATQPPPGRRRSRVARGPRREARPRRPLRAPRTAGPGCPASCQGFSRVNRVAAWGRVRGAMAVHIGIGLFTTQVPPDSGRTFTQEFREVIDLVRLAETLGFESAWV